ncbi:MAG: response regulator [Lachnospiraceae bacterium]|nr:response regulator [Lachnospiraceae bacterium]
MQNRIQEMDVSRDTMLIVDDVAMIRQMVREHFKGQYEVLEATDGKMALDMIRSTKVSIVITDIFMPVMNGLELIKAIRADKAVSKTTVVAITDRGDEHERRVLLAGADDFVNKPLCMELFEHRIRNLLSQKKLQRLTNNLPCGIGICNAYPDGRIQQIYLNDGYYAMLGKTREERMHYYGYSALQVVHENDRLRVQEEVKKAIAEKKDVNLDVRCRLDDTNYKWLNIKGSIVSQTPELTTFNVVYSDIDEMKKLQIRLEEGQLAVEFAKKRGDIALWSYDIDARIVTQEFARHGSVEYPLEIDNVPAVFIRNGSVHPDDMEEYLGIYEKLEKGQRQCEATIRRMNRDTRQYDWIRIIYQRVENREGKNRIALGFSIKVNQQQEHLKRYEVEQHLRKRVFRDYIYYYQVNLTTMVIEEYKNLYGTEQEIQLPSSIGDGWRERILDNVEPSYQKQVEDTIFAKGLLQKFRGGASSAEIVYPRRMITGAYHWVKGTAMIMTNPGTNDIVAFVYIQDIDKEKKEQLAIQSVLDEEIESVILLNIKDLTIDIVMENHQWDGVNQKERFHLGKEFIKALQDHIVEEDRGKYEKFIKLENILSELKKENVLRTTYMVRDKEGTISRKRVRVMYLDEYQEEIVFARRDITDLYEEEEKQKQILENAIDEANAANQAKSEFLSRMSHDMRTPLNAIISLSGEELVEGTDEQQKREFLDKIHASGEYLLGIINDVLDMSKIESQKMILNLEPYAIKEFQDTMKTVIGDQCEQKGISFVVDSKSIVYDSIMLDKVRFNQIFVNLLSNAVKFTPPGGTVELIIEHLKMNGKQAKKRFTVRDNGIGMSKEFLPHAFESFSQENSSRISRNVQGTGLGLSIVKELVKLMGGIIHVESELGKGTSFIVEMNIDVVEHTVYANPTEKSEYALSGTRILLCEDHPINIQIARMLLEKKNCIVTVAENGQIAVDKFAESEPGTYDIILMDIRMPVMDGLTATKKIRALDRADAGTVPIIAMTANAFDEDVQISLNAGMTGHLAKPIDPQIFYATIEKWKNGEERWKEKKNMHC